jgi:hypothetical protein
MAGHRDKLSLPIKEHLTKRLAFDRSTREVDRFGRLHVETSNVTKACVNPYTGQEIMSGAQNGASLSLKSDGIYNLLRDPAELEAAVDTLNRIQILRKHTGVSSANPKKMDVVGCTGSDASWEVPYCRVSVSIWDDAAIAGVETEMQRQFSCSYAYRADMTPGDFNGVTYDGVMRDIQFNHVALVEEGRAGPDVLVGDQLPLEFKSMKKKDAWGQLAASYTALANDAKLPAIIRKTHAKLAADAMKARDEADENEEMAGDEPMDFPGKPADPKDKKGDKAARDEGETEEEREEREAKEKAEKAKDKAAKDKAARDKAAKDEKDERDEKEKKAEDKRATDSAISAAIAANDAKHRDIAEAQAAVRFIIGDVLAADSAEEIYRLGLEARGVDLVGIPKGTAPSVYRTLLQTSQRAAPIGANDSFTGTHDARAALMKEFPTAVLPRRA